MAKNKMVQDYFLDDCFFEDITMTTLSSKMQEEIEDKARAIEIKEFKQENFLKKCSIILSMISLCVSTICLIFTFIIF